MSESPSHKRQRIDSPRVESDSESSTQYLDDPLHSETELSQSTVATEPGSPDVTQPSLHPLQLPQVLLQDMEQKPSPEVTTQTIIRYVSWGVTEQDIDQAKLQMLKDGLNPAEMQDVRWVFIYAKKLQNCFPDQTDHEENEKVHELRKMMGWQSLTDPSSVALQKYEARYNRLDRLVARGEEMLSMVNGQTLFKKFVAEHPEWESPAKVTFRDHPKLEGKNSEVQRIQQPGLCYMHAPVVLQHYLVQMNSQEPLFDHIWNDAGGDAIDVAYQFLDLKDDMKSKLIKYWTATKIWENLVEFGPALVSKFQTHEDFHSDDWVHTNLPSGDLLGGHAMVLVGYRVLEDGSIRFFLQNWWQEKAFVEVSMEYLKAGKPWISFVTTPQLSIGNFPVGEYMHVECDNLDSVDIGQRTAPICKLQLTASKTADCLSQEVDKM